MNSFPLLRFLLFILTTSFFASCSTREWIVPAGYIGSWKTNKTGITVRFKEGSADSQFITDSAFVSIQINNDKTVRGYIGMAAIDNGIILKTWSLPPLKEVQYHIKCDLRGKIFANDPLVEKQVEIWLGDQNNIDMIRASLLKGGSVFPMGLLLFERVD